MGSNLSAYRGCLLGLAVGDAMGYTVDGKTWDEIRRDYGPNGLLGYDLVNGYADVTSHTQLAAFVANGLLLGMTRGQVQGRMAPFVRYVALAEREWAQSQRYHRDPEKTYCWVCQVPELRRRRCMDTRMLDTLAREKLGTPEEPVNRFVSPGAIGAAVAVGLFFDPRRMEGQEVGKLGAETLALTHGAQTAFLSGAFLAYSIAGITAEPEMPLGEHFRHAMAAVEAQFGREYTQASELKGLIRQAMTLAENSIVPPVEAMEQLACRTCAECLAGAVYACLVSPENFDSAMIAAVNHSGRSAAVGAVAGAILGAKLGEEALPEFYLECLEPAGVLRELADDLATGCPMDRASRLFDDTWDQKYIQGHRVEQGGWAEE